MVNSSATDEEVDMAEADVEVAIFERATTFTVLGTPLLSEGRSAELLAVAPQLWLHAKVYADGGERGLHSHPTEDHAFFVLAGSARFEDVAGTVTEIGAYQGIMIPRGVVYSFESSGAEGLVILRIGAGAESTQSGGRLLAKHSQGYGGQPAKKPGAGVPIPGRVFTAPGADNGN
jgi:mannose-6-phosphate isomerase-like protein (cupin superfamily)